MQSILYIGVKIVRASILIYRRTLSPDHGPASRIFGNSKCRFFPSCSVYAEEAFRRYGLGKGAFFVLKRISRCHPWNRGGFDPVP